MNVAEQKLKLPAIFLIIIGSLAVIFNLGSAAMGFLGNNAANLDGLVADPQMKQLLSATSGVMGGIISLVMACIAGFLIFGSIKMMKGQSYGLAMAAAIIAIIPCYFNCCLGTPIGIWALVMLLNDEVKASFNGNTAQA